MRAHHTHQAPARGGMHPCCALVLRHNAPPLHPAVATSTSSPLPPPRVPVNIDIPDPVASSFWILLSAGHL
jgi:hypothetical protein